MKGYEYWAKQAMAPLDTIAETYAEMSDRPRREHDYIAGFKRGREKAAELIEGFHNPKFNGVPLLIRAIGEGDTSDMERP
jgi:hypothetical protein